MFTISQSGTSKQRPQLDLDGFSYVRDRITSDKIYWRCIKYKSDHCHARLHTCLESKTILKHTGDHICKFDATENQVRQFSQQVTGRALNTQEDPDVIVTNCYKKLSDPSLARLPVRDNIKRRIRMLRQKNQIVKEPNDPQFQSVPTQLTLNHRQEQFLQCDTCPGDDRILIFASPEQLHVLQTSQDFLVDGTFKVVPEIFYQLFIIHAVYRQHTVPVVYALLRRKDAGTYTCLFDEIVKIAPNWLPASSLGHQAQYQKDSTFSHNIHKIAALAFLDPNSVLNGFESLCEQLDDQYDNILDYFEETYIGKLRSNRVRRKPLFEINFWSMHHRTTQLSMRTNNSAEAYHRRINSVFQCSHPTLWLFLQRLIDEENVVHADLV
ncbi:unnamed protein product [Rotaria magnacalcarata]|uniref:FLYWCH-type domain-containing protein n=2 Tax=Rotaria magnacalcarata TaxID=392030 RepID=A0A819ZW32_9BILA|nr:unnamed protein product [Rotaria magnacalcarata]CAF4176676.1 unnamed protein product [Rotaria magnacalcarata]